MSQPATERLSTEKVRAGEATLVDDDLIVEEPLSIELDGVLVASTMRTPGDDFDLAVGFCLTDGLITAGELPRLRGCLGSPSIAAASNVVAIDTGRPQLVNGPVATARALISSSCGLCGSDAIHELADRIGPLPDHEPWDRTLLVSLADRVEGHQPLHDATGSVHVAVAFDRAGNVVVAREDIGRHNAVDKVIGRLLLDARLPANDLVLFVSSRASFEMVQKAWAGGFSALVAVSGPSALAVQSARRAGMTLAGFARAGRANFYSPEGA